MKVKVIRKGRKVRVVYACSRREKQELRRLGTIIAAAERVLAAKYGVQEVAHGFVSGRSQVTCALPHVGEWAVTINLDLAGWFDSVTLRQVADALAEAGVQDSEKLANAVCILGEPPSPRPGELAPRQGLPSSPAAANLAAVKMDSDILNRLNSLGCLYAYTRYADDLSVSIMDASLVSRVISEIREAVSAMGWAIAEHKVNVQYARSGRRVVVGLSVGPDGIRPRRKTRRKLRAAMNNNPRSRSALGLAEWCSCPLPRAVRPKRVVQGHPMALDNQMVPANMNQAMPRLTLGAAKRRVIVGGSGNEASS